MSNPYLEFVEGIEAGISKARGVEASGQAETSESGPVVLLFSPHPDDECITGLLPLRLAREAGRQIVNVPVTYGSNPERQAARAAELEAACGFLGWRIHQGRDNLRSLGVDGATRIIEELEPEIIFLPHARDWNARHISTHFLVMEALANTDPGFSCLLAETEFWAAMESPNLLVEGDARSVADLVAATSLHTGEVARNPYHLLLPAWMQDNVRRGGELVGGQGEAAPDFSFATLYHLRRWSEGRTQKVMEGGTVLPLGADLEALLRN